MTTILALDAAWTATEPTGVALVTSAGPGWRAVAVAPSYDSFLALADGTSVRWTQARFSGSVPDIPKLLDAAQRLANSPVNLVTIDMPIATCPITARRDADNAISKRFGSRGCSTHTPSASRPGPLGECITTAFNREGFLIATKQTSATLANRLLEVYPHPALLALLDRTYRVPYKVGNTRRYWPDRTRQGRIDALLSEYAAIHEALVNVFGPIGVPLPTADNGLTFSALKCFEDALDALVCAWVGVCYMQGTAIAYGDDTAVIWCPSDA